MANFELPMKHVTKHAVLVAYAYAHYALQGSEALVLAGGKPDFKLTKKPDFEEARDVADVAKKISEVHGWDEGPLKRFFTSAADNRNVITLEELKRCLSKQPSNWKTVGQTVEKMFPSVDVDVDMHEEKQLALAIKLSMQGSQPCEKEEVKAAASTVNVETIKYALQTYETFRKIAKKHFNLTMAGNSITSWSAKATQAGQKESVEMQALYLNWIQPQIAGLVEEWGQVKKESELRAVNRWFTKAKKLQKMISNNTELNEAILGAQKIIQD